MLFPRTPANALAQFSAIPPCARPCLLTALGSGICNMLDIDCFCTNEALNANVSTCLTASSCTIPELLATQNMSMTACGISARDRGPRAELYTCILFGAAFAAVLTRFIYRWILSRIDLGIDDLFVLASMLTLLASFVVTTCGLVRHGLGQDTWSLHPDTITEFMKFVYVAGALYFCETALLKFGFLFFYLRIFTETVAKRVLWVTIILVAIWGTVFQFVMLFRCQPMSFNWEYWDNLHHGKCLIGPPFAFWHGAISIAIDIWMLAIPLWQVWGLQMHWKKKARVASMFILGTLVTVVSALRLSAIIHVTMSTNPTWELYDAFLWSKLEIGVGIIWQVNYYACLPTIRQFFVHLFPSVMGSVARSHGYHFDHERRNRRNKTSQGHSSFSATGLKGSTTLGGGSTLKGQDEDQTNIMMETLSPDQHSQCHGDEMSLVSHGQSEVRPQSHQSVV